MGYFYQVFIDFFLTMLCPNCFLHMDHKINEVGTDSFPAMKEDSVVPLSGLKVKSEIFFYLIWCLGSGLTLFFYFLFLIYLEEDMTF